MSQRLPLSNLRSLQHIPTIDVPWRNFLCRELWTRFQREVSLFWRRPDRCRLLLIVTGYFSSSWISAPGYDLGFRVIGLLFMVTVGVSKVRVKIVRVGLLFGIGYFRVGLGCRNNVCVGVRSATRAP